MKLIDKAALVAEMERRKNICQGVANANENNEFTHLYYEGKAEAYSEMSEFLDTIEAKEVDLEKELDNWWHEHFHGRRDKDASGEYLKRESQLDLVRHFFELGIKAQKGE